MKPHFQLIIALIAGLLAGITLHPHAQDPWLQNLSTHFLAPVGQIFLRMIFMVVVPMVVSALVVGVYELGRGQNLGKIARRTLLYTVLASTVSVLIGITLVNTIQPGKSFQMDSSLLAAQNTQVQAVEKNALAAKPLSQAVVELIPKNPLDSALHALDGEMISLMIFALIFGLALAAYSRKESEKPLLHSLFEQLFATCMKIVEYAMKLAPAAVFALVFNSALKFGAGIFASLLLYAGTVVLGLLIQQFVTYSILLKTVARRSPLEFFKNCREVYLYAFATASSNATLPKSLETAETKLGIPSRISRFVLTVGSTANQNGTALFEGITVLFLAQVYQVDLSMGQQIQVVLMSILAGIGTAGVPGGSLPLIMILLQQMGIPAEGLGLILGIDRFLDMCRTTLNVSGDLVIAAMVAGSETNARS